MEIEHHLFCVLNLFNFKLQNLGELRVVLLKPTLKMKEFKGIRGGLPKPEVQPIHSGAICPVLLANQIVQDCATCWQEISNVCVSCLRDLPHTYFFCTCFIRQKETTVETNKGSPGLKTRELKSFYYYYCLLIIVYIFLSVHLTYYFFQF